MPANLHTLDHPCLLIIAQCLLDPKSVGILGLVHPRIRQETSHVMLQADPVELCLDEPRLVESFCAFAFGQSSSGRPRYVHLRHLSITCQGYNLLVIPPFPSESLLQLLSKLKLLSLNTDLNTGNGLGYEPIYTLQSPSPCKLPEVKYISGMACGLHLICLDTKVHCLYLHYNERTNCKDGMIQNVCGTLQPQVLCFNLASGEPPDSLLGAIKASKSTLEALEIDIYCTVAESSTENPFRATLMTLQLVMYKLANTDVKYVSLRFDIPPDRKGILSGELVDLFQENLLSDLRQYTIEPRKLRSRGLQEVLLSFYPAANAIPIRCVKWMETGTGISPCCSGTVHEQTPQQQVAWRHDVLGERHASKFDCIEQRAVFLR
ncbi:hypothetical protein QCA50_011542 [Cerrena zonata]|uniref:Uncharacterized protein n=1 Tax=Cerrena zonata TaxID=2478898 RepID=A0AAW0G4D5_9APHY